ncbi:MAG: nucleotidyltransferase family protein [Patescibacteria group bacterium]
MNAVILAGAKAAELGRHSIQGGYRAGLVIGGRSLLDQALCALSALPDLDRVVLVGPDDLAASEYRAMLTEVVAPGEDLVENLRRGLSVLPPEEQALVVASDLPLLTRAALSDFIQSCAKRPAEIHYPIIRRETYEAAYPGSLRTYLTLRDGTFTGGNIVLLTPAAFYRHEHWIATAVAWRKNPRRLGRLLGLGFFLGLRCRRYSVADLEARVAARLGVQAVAVETRFSEIGFDVDSDADVDWIDFYWGGSIEGTGLGNREPDEE